MCDNNYTFPFGTRTEVPIQSELEYVNATESPYRILRDKLTEELLNVKEFKVNEQEIILPDEELLHVCRLLHPITCRSANNMKLIDFVIRAMLLGKRDNIGDKALKRALSALVMYWKNCTSAFADSSYSLTVAPGCIEDGLQFVIARTLR